MTHKSNSNKDNSDNYVDLAAERLAELFIEQAMYNRSHKGVKGPSVSQYIEQIKLSLRYSWDPVPAASNGYRNCGP